MKNTLDKQGYLDNMEQLIGKTIQISDNDENAIGEVLNANPTSIEIFCNMYNEPKIIKLRKDFKIYIIGK